MGDLMDDMEEIVECDENIYVTEDFVKTIRGRNNANTHLKNPSTGIPMDRPGVRQRLWSAISRRYIAVSSSPGRSWDRRST